MLMPNNLLWWCSKGHEHDTAAMQDDSIILCMTTEQHCDAAVCLQGGGSEVWKTPKNTVVTSLTFHPSGQVLLVATSNNILFWDWSQSEPFAQCATRSSYEKVRSVLISWSGQGASWIMYNLYSSASQSGHPSEMTMHTFKMAVLSQSFYFSIETCVS